MHSQHCRKASPPGLGGAAAHCPRRKGHLALANRRASRSIRVAGEPAPSDSHPHLTYAMKLIRFIVKAVATWSLLLFLLGAAFAVDPRAIEDVLGLLAFGFIAGGLLSRLLG